MMVMSATQRAMLKCDELYSGPVVAGCGNSGLDQRLEPVAGPGAEATSAC